ncbi:hypothetical protein JOC77_002488 [Peribacillus deserti]|uniref:Uncharacterized protein n=1 Tax=Peribacillus deserti TaxID=673318 RepID=A0ABS2QK22_9BACI|nr:hypothetical protein [Peribacillus deserti]MBM7693049.1 hypothetical protein [Peribacillus deserti]
MGRKRKHHESSSIGFDILVNHKFCDDDFLIRLAGLEGGLNFRLKQMIGKCVEIFLSEPENEVIIGEVAMVGSNFVELCSCKKDKEHCPKEDLIKIIPIDNIKKIMLVDKCHDHLECKHHKHCKCKHHKNLKHHAACFCKICKSRRRVIKH